jgi:zinc transport system ATP-binding protein
LQINSAVKFDNVSFGYGDIDVIRDISFEIKSGEFVLFTGPNGGGKTTAVKLICSLLKPTKGSVELFNNPRIGYLAQKKQEFDFYFPITVYEAVELACFGNDFGGKAERKKNTLEALDRVGLLELKGRFMNELSGGQKQRVFIARALALMPDILIMDEPTTGIDSISQDALFEFITDFRAKKETTVIYVTHDVSDVCSMSDRRLEFSGGTVVKKELSEGCGCHLA